LKKRKLLLLSILIGGMVWNTGCSGKSTEPLPQLVIGCDNYRPYNYADEDGEQAGIDVDLASEACRRMGYEPVFVPIEWNERDNYLNTGEIDCIWSCYSMDQEGDYEWVGPYMYSRQVVAVLGDSPIHKLSDLNGKSIAVRVSSPAEDIFLTQADANVPKAENVYSLDDIDAVVTALRNDYVDACAGYAATLTELLNSIDINYRFLEEDLSRAELGIAFSKDSDPALRERLSDTLEEMQSDGTTRQILENYGLNADKALGEN